MSAEARSQVISAPHSRLWLREATPEDAPLLLAIVQAAFEEYRGRLTPPSGAHSETEEKLALTLGRERAVLAGLNDTVVGCVFYHLTATETYLHRLAVLPAWRQTGIGRALVAYVETQARTDGSPRVRLGVRLQLPENQAFYAKLGYTVHSHGSHPGFTTPTFVTMEKELTGPPDPG